MITIEGLTAKQKVLCDIMWAMNGKHEVESFIRSLPKADRLMATSLVEMMICATIDEIDSVDEAKIVLDKIAKL